MHNAQPGRAAPLAGPAHVRQPGAFRPVEPRTAAETIALGLKRAILSGVLLPGTRLQQNQIAADYGASSTPVREAFRILRAEGFVEIDPRVGAAVRSITAREVEELYTVRSTLEALALRNAVPRLDDAQIAVVATYLQSMKATTDSSDYIDAHNNFHLALYQAAAMPNLSDLILQMRNRFSLAYSILGAVFPPGYETIEQHAAILKACELRDPDLAVEKLIQHFENHKRALLGYITSADFTRT